MGEFSPEWLTLREPADHAARSAGLVEAVASRLAGPRPVRILDLGSGTGSNARYVMPRLGPPQAWCLADRDRELLARATPCLSAWGLTRGAVASGDTRGFALRGPGVDCRFELRAVNLAGLAAEGAGRGAGLFEGRDLVTASALLDLVSARWLTALAGQCARSGAVALFALTYDGRVRCTPEDVDDAFVRGLVNRHQHRVKGFGRALGPDAPEAAAQAFEEAGYDVRCEPSDWQLTPAQRDLQRGVIEGWASAASEVDPAAQARVDQWLARRLACVEAGASRVQVGHQDLAAWPRGSG